MASIKSLPFVIETSIMLHNDHTRRRRFQFLTRRRRLAGDVSLVSGLESGVSISSSCWRRGVKPVKAMGKVNVDGEEDGGESEEDALQATIEKIKKVLAMQRDLLQQIAERRKLVSSITSSSPDEEEDDGSFGQGESFSDVGNCCLLLDFRLALCMVALSQSSFVSYIVSSTLPSLPISKDNG